MVKQPLRLLDACAFINLYASRHLEPILGFENASYALVAGAARESRFVFRGGAGPASRTRDAIAWDTLTSSGVLQLLDDLSEDEAALYLDLVLDLGDGEAMTGAVAYHRDCVVICDDKKASRILGELGIDVRTSLELIAKWSVHAAIPANALQTVLTDIQVRARYIPARSHPYYAWWAAAMASDP